MTVENGDRPVRNPAWSWIAAAVAVLLVHVVLVAVSAIDPGAGNLVVVAAILVAAGAVHGVADWLRRRGR